MDTVWTFDHGSTPAPPNEVSPDSGGSFSTGFSNSGTDPSSAGSEAQSPEYDDSATSNPILKFISEILMEEDLDEQPHMLQDCLALQAAEKSFYDVLNQDDTVPSSGCGQFLSDRHINNSVGAVQAPESGTSGSTREVISEGKRSHGREEEEEEGDFAQEGRSNKQSAVYMEVTEQMELFDEVLLCQAGKGDQLSRLYGDCQNKQDRNLAETGMRKESSGRIGARRKKDNTKGEVIDLFSLLTQCAQAVVVNDHRSSTKLIKQIRQHSSPYGDGNQRVAHCFVNGLEARLAGNEAPSYMAMAKTGSSAADILKAYQFFVQACPFKRMADFYANRTIMRKAEKETTLHIIDFGILYGFQWPCLIQHISKRGGRLPKIRMTGIELPQPGFRPAERVEETGRRLAKYCGRFGIEFEYYAVAKKWETIELEDIKIDRDDFIVVNCQDRFRNLLDESVVLNSPRDTVLKLIRKIEPNLFVHGIVNGAYNAPFFLTRFKAALFHFSSLFDMLDVGGQNVRENEERLIFEKEIFGRDAMNVIACEGVARVERPETYKQSQARNTRAGFRQIPLYEDIFRKVKNVVKSEYHRDFDIDQDGHWILLGWKGRVLHAVSCWVPAKD